MSISSVTSESLQLKLRQLLPSQQGFGTDLSASDTIIPVIDLTGAAEGSDTPQYLQTALAFGSQTPFEIAGTTLVIANSPGFYRVVGVSNVNDNGSNVGGGFTMTDGTTVKQIWGNIGAGSSDRETVDFDLVFFLDVDVSLTVFADTTGTAMAGSIRQVATSNGTLVQPVGFTPQ